MIHFLVDLLLFGLQLFGPWGLPEGRDTNELLPLLIRRAEIFQQRSKQSHLEASGRQNVNTTVLGVVLVSL
jgi:hypothetical protein